MHFKKRRVKVKFEYDFVDARCFIIIVFLKLAEYLSDSIMKRCWTGFVLLFAGVVLARVNNPCRPTKQPNIIFILCDDVVSIYNCS